VAWGSADPEIGSFSAIRKDPVPDAGSFVRVR
jgi:hypothetical protein